MGKYTPNWLRTTLRVTDWVPLVGTVARGSQAVALNTMALLQPNPYKRKQLAAEAKESFTQGAINASGDVLGVLTAGVGKAVFGASRLAVSVGSKVAAEGAARVAARTAEGAGARLASREAAEVAAREAATKAIQEEGAHELVVGSEKTAVKLSVKEATEAAEKAALKTAAAREARDVSFKRVEKLAEQKAAREAAMKEAARKAEAEAARKASRSTLERVTSYAPLTVTEIGIGAGLNAAFTGASAGYDALSSHHMLPWQKRHLPPDPDERPSDGKDDRQQMQTHEGVDPQLLQGGVDPMNPQGVDPGGVMDPGLQISVAPVAVAALAVGGALLVSKAR